MLVNDKNVFINFVFCLIELKTVSVVKIIIIKEKKLWKEWLKKEQKT